MKPMIRDFLPFVVQRGCLSQRTVVALP